MKKYIKIYLKKADWKQSICVRSIKEAQNIKRTWIDQEPLTIKSKDKRAKQELDIYQLLLIQGVN